MKYNEYISLGNPDKNIAPEFSYQVYTNLYISKHVCKYDENPQVKVNLTYTGTKQDLMQSLGVVTGSTGTIMFNVDGGIYSPTMPQAADAGLHTINYYIKSDDNHVDSDIKTAIVQIAENDDVQSVINAGVEANMTVAVEAINAAKALIEEISLQNYSVAALEEKVISLNEEENPEEYEKWMKALNKANQNKVKVAIDAQLAINTAKEAVDNANFAARRANAENEINRITNELMPALANLNVTYNEAIAENDEDFGSED